MQYYIFKHDDHSKSGYNHAVNVKDQFENVLLYTSSILKLLQIRSIRCLLTIQVKQLRLEALLQRITMTSRRMSSDRCAVHFAYDLLEHPIAYSPQQVYEFEQVIHPHSCNLRDIVNKFHTNNSNNRSIKRWLQAKWMACHFVTFIQWRMSTKRVILIAVWNQFNTQCYLHSIDQKNQNKIQFDMIPYGPRVLQLKYKNIKLAWISAFPHFLLDASAE